MKPLPIKKRRQIYRKAHLQLADDTANFGYLCGLLLDLAGRHDGTASYRDVLKLFPEFELFEPMLEDSRGSLTWWAPCYENYNNKEARMIALAFMYQMTFK